MKKLYTLLSAILITAGVAQAQQADQPVRFLSGNFITGSNITARSFALSQIQTSLYNGRYYLLVQFNRLPDEARRTQLRQLGVELLEYVPGYAYLATIRKDFPFVQAGQFEIRSINSIPSFYKKDRTLDSIPVSYDKQQVKHLVITLYPGFDKPEAITVLQRLGAAIVHDTYNMPSVVFVQPNAALLEAIAALPFVSGITLQSIKDKPLNYNSKGAHSIHALTSPAGAGLSGRGVTAGVGDDGDVSTHIDFTGRLINRVFTYPTNHGTHVTGTMGGAGLLDPLYIGNAPKARIVSQYYSDIITNTPTYITDYNMVLTNNSYYSSDNGCAGNSRYDVTSNLADLQLRTYPQLLHVVAVGNDGSFSCGGYPAAFATVKSGWQTGKNVLTVGAMKSDDYGIAPFSSRGPLLDGRLKPEMVANGWAVSSTYAGNIYAWFFGTSMAAPNVTGATALLYERYRQTHGGADPDAALIKTLLCNSAEDLGNAGPDFTFGFGMLNARRTLAAMENNTYFTGTVTNGATATHTLNVPSGTRRLKVMLYWPDKEAAPNAATALVNDLDLVVTTPSAVQHLPLVLNPAPGAVTALAAEGADHRNNIEQVVIEDPAAGTYTFTVNGGTVPFGPQNYVLAYEVVAPHVTVEYPFGGETWIPGAAETIRWTAAGDDNNTFTIEYSLDNGGVWTTIDNAVSPALRSYNWTAPATITNTALVRVSRNSSSLTGQSHAPFMILGQTDITLTNACDGAVDISWPSVSSATSYDVMQLAGDSMQVIANTTSLSYLVTGLNRNTTYWFGVRAKNGSVAGRRSVSKDIIPSGGPCLLSSFDNDIKAEAILSPSTGREYTLSAATPAMPITVRLKNLDNVPVSSTMDVSYSINGGAPVTESFTASFTAGGTQVHTFAPHTVPATGPFVMNIKVWVTNPGDNDHLNDTITKVVKRLENDPLTVLPVTEGFEATGIAEYRNAVMGLEGNDHFDFINNTALGRARTFVNTGFARTGSRAVTLDQAPISNSTTADSLILTYNLLPFTAMTSELRFDFYYKNHAQDNYPGNRVWIRGSETGNWVQAYDLFANQAGINQWKRGDININEVLGSAVPPQVVTSSFQVKFGQEGKTSANSVVQILDYDDGYTFDDMRIAEALNDVALKTIVSPDKKGCALGSATPVTIQVKNYNNSTLNNIAVSYRLNSGAVVTETIPSLTPYQVLDYTFTATADLSAYTDYSFDFWINYGSDSYRGNDSLLAYSFHNSPLITNYPYLEGFETNNGEWYAKGNSSSWQWGTPAKPIINKAANGVKAWVTSLTGRYNNSEVSYLYSPCFDLSSMTQPVLSFSHIYDLEDNCPCDYSWVEYSTDGGLTWQKLGTSVTGTNWYTDALTNRWQTSFRTWHVASTDIPSTGSNVRFRFVMSADGGVTFEGVGIDDVHVFDKQAIYTGTPITSGLAQTVSGNGWIHFNDPGGKRIVSINPYGQNLGVTEVQVYPYPGPVRVSNNQYYADRNIVVRPTNQPATNVAVRFYFTDTEAKDLIAATGCASCTKPNDPYELGVTQYSGPVAEENGTLADNLSAFHNYINPANTDIIPYDNGYYAEYAVSGFSEFWLNNGGVSGNEPLPLNLLSFEAVKQNGEGLLRWITAAEQDMDRIVIERSGDGRFFTQIGSLAALGGLRDNQYRFTDASPLKRLNYYRLRLVNRDGSFAYSPVRRLNFGGTGGEVVLYPNPVSNGVLLLASSTNLSRGILTDVSGKMVKTFVLQGRNNRLEVAGLAKGIYQLKVFGDEGQTVHKVIIQ